MYTCIIGTGYWTRHQCDTGKTFVKRFRETYKWHLISHLNGQCFWIFLKNKHTTAHISLSHHQYELRGSFVSYLEKNTLRHRESIINVNPWKAGNAVINAVGTAVARPPSHCRPTIKRYFDRIRNSTNICNALVQNVLNRSQQILNTPRQCNCLSWSVQNFVVIAYVYFKLEHSKFWSNFEFDRNIEI